MPRVGKEGADIHIAELVDQHSFPNTARAEIKLPIEVVILIVCLFELPDFPLEDRQGG